MRRDVEFSFERSPTHSSKAVEVRVRPLAETEGGGRCSSALVRAANSRRVCPRMLRSSAFYRISPLSGLSRSMYNNNNINIDPCFFTS
jgi:hypothetical protein